MFTLEGRASLARLYQDANRLIWAGIDRWIATEARPVLVKPLPFDSSEMDELGEPDPVMDLIENADGPMVHANIEGAARLVCVNLIAENGSYVELLSPYGAIPRASIGFFGNAVRFARHGWRHDETDALMATSKSFQTAMFKADGWQELFVTNRLFEDESYAFVDWAIGTVDVSILEAARRGAAQVRGDSSRRDDDFPPLDSGLLALLRPYHGCPIMVPEAWLSQLSLEPPRSRREGETDPIYESLRPHERILEYKRRNPKATKFSIKLALFPDFSHRQFAYYFRMASEAQPSLSLPGRKASA